MKTPFMSINQTKTWLTSNRPVYEPEIFMVPRRKALSVALQILFDAAMAGSRRDALISFVLREEPAR